MENSFLLAKQGSIFETNSSLPVRYFKYLLFNLVLLSYNYSLHKSSQKSKISHLFCLWISHLNCGTNLGSGCSLRFSFSVWSCFAKWGTARPRSILPWEKLEGTQQDPCSQSTCTCRFVQYLENSWILAVYVSKQPEVQQLMTFWFHPLFIPKSSFDVRVHLWCC